MKICALILAFSAIAIAEDKPTVHAPDDLQPSEVVPVLLVEQGLADSYAKLWPVLSKRMRLIVVETVPLRTMLKLPDARARIDAAMLDALREANAMHPLNRCPRVVLAFSASAPHMGFAALNRHRLYQGLLLVNSALSERDLPPKLDAARGMPVTLIHGARDPGVPLAHAKSVMEALEAAGLDASLEVIDTAEHKAPLTGKGLAVIGKYLEGIASRSIVDVAIPVAPERIETEAADGLKLTADLYETGDRSDPIILLFHQARSSRGEYREIAPRLVEAGYNCLALDQRSGNGWLGVANETAARAKAAGTPQDYHDAKPDLVRAAAWARELGFKGRLAILGSSYSAALAVILGSEVEGIDAVIAFSPGDYVQPRGSVFEGAKKLKVPTLIVCPLNEKAQAKPIHDVVGSDEADFHAFPKAVHGASMLYRSAQAEEIWRVLLQFLLGTLKEEER